MRKIHSVNLQADSKILYFLIHGYTGSPTDFDGLPEYLQKTQKANVKIMLLPGHGTRIEDLDSLELNDFLIPIENELKKNLDLYDKIIIGGVSFGAQVALYLATKYPVQGVFDVSAPYKFRFLFNIPGIALLGRIKKYWSKSISGKELELREHAVYYKAMHSNGLKLAKQLSQILSKEIFKIKCPILSIHSKHDTLGNYKGLKLLDRKIKVLHKIVLFNDKKHNLFFTKRRFDIQKIVQKFFEPILTETENKKNKIAAIVPAYNEGANLAKVLNVLTQTKILDEIIVIDDGSNDNTIEIAKEFTQVLLLKNKQNKGKAYAMQSGVEATTANILFFCDADLKGLTTEIVNQIITPVINKQYDMFIGVRNNVMQKSITLFALNSGERALTRELWNKLPEIFKYRYRIEAGLNFIAKTKGKGYGWKRFAYYQTLKEKKYGFLKGTVLRWWMNFDVAYAYLLVLLKWKN